MYDALTTRYRLSCPHRGETSVPLSHFRRLDELPGPHHPTVYRIEFACACGDVHPGLVPHDDLDWAPLGLSKQTEFVNFMTDRRDSLALELSDLAAQRIKSGEWPWSFFCWPEERPRPVFPSAFWLLGTAERGELVVVAVRCPACAMLSVNLVTRAHVDLPFHNDRDVGVLTRRFDPVDDSKPADVGLLDASLIGFENRRMAA
jgi:hypothetical protein